jgi:signal transduction histidine kinase
MSSHQPTALPITEQPFPVKWRTIYEASLAIQGCSTAPDILRESADQITLMTSSLAAAAAIFDAEHQAILSIETTGIDTEAAELLLTSLYKRRRAASPALSSAIIRNDFHGPANAPFKIGAAGITSVCVVPNELSPGRLLLLTAVNRADGADFSVAETDTIAQFARSVTPALQGMSTDQDLKPSEERESLAAVFAHELRNQMTIISGYGQLLQRRLKDTDATLFKPLQIIDTHMARLSQMIDDMLDASKFEDGRMTLSRETVRLLDLLEYSRQMNSELTPNYHFKLEVLGDPPLIQLDRCRIEQVLTNLIHNALKYTPEGETITMRLESGKHEAIVSVIDPGTGIPETEQAKIFEPYFRGSQPSLKTSGGTGLGLYICRMIVQAHGGNIAVSSKLGQGSTFSFSLPYRTNY